MLLTSKNYYGSKCVKNRVSCDLSSNIKELLFYFLVTERQNDKGEHS